MCISKLDPLKFEVDFKLYNLNIDFFISDYLLHHLHTRIFHPQWVCLNTVAAHELHQVWSHCVYNLLHPFCLVWGQHNSSPDHLMLKLFSLWELSTVKRKKPIAITCEWCTIFCTDSEVYCITYLYHCKDISYHSIAL